MTSSIGKMFVEIGADTTGLDKGLDKSEKRISSLGGAFKKHGKAIGAGMTAVGGGMLALSTASKKTNASLGVTALQLGSTKEEMRELALATSNVTFPMEEVTSTFDLLTRSGMTNKEQIAATATAFDTLGDAIGKPASEVTTSLIPAFNAYNISLEDAGDYTDMFTHLTRNTTVGLDEFGGMLNYLAADLGTMDISIEQSVAVMEALADKGIQGSAATREFRTAINQADGDINLFYEALGLTADGVAGYTKNIQDADGITQDYADAQNEQFGLVDKLKHGWSELSLSLGSVMEPFEGVAGIMVTMGPLLMAVSSSVTLLSAAQGIHAAAAWAAVAPYLAVIAPIAAVIAVVAIIVGALYVLEKKFGLITWIVDKFGDKLLILLGPIGWVLYAFRNWEEIKTVVGNIFDYIVGVMAGLGDKLLFLLGPIGAIVYAFRNWKQIETMVSGMFNRIIGYITGFKDQAVSQFMAVISFIESLNTRFYNAGYSIISALANGIKAKMNEAIQAVRDGMTKIRRYLPHSDADEGPLKDLTSSGEALISTFAKGIEKSNIDIGKVFADQLPDTNSVVSSSTSKIEYAQPTTPAAGTVPETPTGPAGGSSINIGEVHLSESYNFEKLMDDINKYQQSNRIQRGIGVI